MTERPIILSAESVRAVLAGTKTQTRCVVREQEALTFLVREDCREDGDLVVSYMPDHPRGAGWYAYCGEYREEGAEALGAPYGRPGDRLWVREAWDFLPAGEPGARDNVQVVYWADGGTESRTAPADFNPVIFGREAHRSPIHMPRWASRITLEVTGVRVERLLDIDYEDAVAEGFGVYDNRGFLRGEESIEAFAEGWDRINAKRGHPWDSNPWVWVVTFRRLEEAPDA